MEGADLAAYDTNNDGYVTWAEFYDVYMRQNITVKWTLSEQIFYTLEDPDSSISATFVSFFVLFVIVVSSFCFIFSTVPTFQENLDHKDGPKAIKILDVIDGICLVIFVVEYLMRLLTSWNVRTEISRKNQTALVALVVGYGPISLPSPLVRVIYFFFAPANLVDLVAILPGVLSAFVNIEGGGFVVLRLIRLTRLFRVFKSRSLIEPVIIIGRTLSQSTSALYILMFNLLLGVVISGSLIYIVEGLGTWDVEKQVYLRDVGLEWNETAGKFETLRSPTPFASIPHSFWWSLVTIMTVGYGDDYPITGWGKVVAAGTMLFSLVMLALPVGVVGGNFSQVWADFEQTKSVDEDMMKREQQFVVSQMAKLDPDKLSKTMLIEIWDDSGIASDEVMRRGPSWNYFMGQATCHLDLPCDRNAEKEVTLTLENNPDICDRKIKGSVTIKYKWTPDPITRSNSGQVGPIPSEHICQLHGLLQVTIVSGHGLLNLVNKGNSGRSSSSPYCRVYVYPRRPVEGAMLTPAVWCTPTCLRNLSPIWNVTDTFVYEWKCPDGNPKPDGRTPVCVMSSCRQSLKPEDNMLDEALMALQILYTEMNMMKETISILNQRVAIMSTEELERLKFLQLQKELQANGSGIASAQALEDESEDGEVPESEPRDMSSIGSEESV